MLSSQVKFSADRQTNGQTDTCKTICPRSIDSGALKGEKSPVYMTLLCTFEIPLYSLPKQKL